MHLFWARKEREAKKRRASAVAARKKEQPVRSSDSGGQGNPVANRSLLYLRSEWGHLAASCPKNCQSYPFVQPVLHAGLVNMCNVSNKVLGASVTNVCTKVTELPPFSGQQMFYNKVDKVSEVTNYSLFVEPGLQGHLVNSSVIETELADEMSCMLLP